MTFGQIAKLEYEYEERAAIKIDSRIPKSDAECQACTEVYGKAKAPCPHKPPHREAKLL